MALGSVVADQATAARSRWTRVAKRAQKVTGPAESDPGEFLGPECGGHLGDGRGQLRDGCCAGRRDPVGRKRRARRVDECEDGRRRGRADVGFAVLHGVFSVVASACCGSGAGPEQDGVRIAITGYVRE